MHPDKKTITPINVGGLAGGLKYVCQNIFFKFALDVQVRKRDEKGESSTFTFVSDVSCISMRILDGCMEARKELMRRR